MRRAPLARASRRNGRQWGTNRAADPNRPSPRAPSGERRSSPRVQDPCHRVFNSSRPSLLIRCDCDSAPLYLHSYFVVVISRMFRRVYISLVRRVSHVSVASLSFPILRVGLASVSLSPKVRALKPPGGDRGTYVQTRARRTGPRRAQSFSPFDTCVILYKINGAESPNYLLNHCSHCSPACICCQFIE